MEFGSTIASPSLEDLPQEVLINILTFLPVDDLLKASRTCHLFRKLSTDPLLHHERLRDASHSLAMAISQRPPKASICPPNSWIWLSKTNVLSRSISKSLVRIRLSHNLEHRPSSRDLVARAVLPASCRNIAPALVQSHYAVYKRRLKDNLSRKLDRRPSMKSLVSMNIIPEECAKQSVSPALLATRKQVMKESLKDGLRAWVGNRGVQAQKRKADEIEAAERTTVKNLVRRFAAKKLADDFEARCDAVSLEKRKAQMRWGRELEVQRKKDERRMSWGAGVSAQPTRAHVLHLKRFWEGVIRTPAG